jgi:hypothetical protein
MHCKWTVWCSRVHKRSMAIEVLQVAGHHGTGLWCIPCPPQDAALVAQVKGNFSTQESLGLLLTMNKKCASFKT